MSPITTHILDTSRGLPAPGVRVSLFAKQPDGSWSLQGQGQTDEDGRLKGLLPPGPLEGGAWRISFETGEYFRACGVEKFFYPLVNIDFLVEEGRAHYHVPLLLNPFGFSTYRGS